jgi:hypothetical protein
MSTNKQIDANRENAQKSTGPSSADGLKRSSLNSTTHGFTGQTLVLSAAEQAPYEAFVQQMRQEFNPCTAESRELLQNYTDLRWSIQQITVQQNNILAIMNVITQHHIDTDDLAGMDAALEPHTRRLKILGTYEQRRRRAAKETLTEFNKVEQEHYNAQQEHLRAAADAHQDFQKLGQTWDPKEFGFVCSLQQIEQFIAKKDNELFLAMLRQEAGKQGADQEVSA